MKKIDLANDKISKLLVAFSVPCIISMLVNAFYNIIDQIFIGQGVGYLGNGATNVVFPLTMVCLAFALMFGDGGAAYLSLKLGEKKPKEAAKGVGNAVAISSIISIAFCAITLIFLFLSTSTIETEQFLEEVSTARIFIFLFPLFLIFLNPNYRHHYL